MPYSGCSALHGMNPFFFFFLNPFLPALPLFKHFSAICKTLNNSHKAIDKGILKLLSSLFLTKVIVDGDLKYSDIQNHDIVNRTIIYILDSKRFDCSLM